MSRGVAADAASGVLAPMVSPEELLPEGAAFMARTDLHQTRMLGYTVFNLDAVTTLLLGVLGRRTTLRHRAGVTDEILGFLEHAGLRIEEDMRVFHGTEEAVARAREIVAEGQKLFWPYPPAPKLYDEAAHLVPPSLWARLNSKEALPEIVPPGGLAARELRAIDDLDGLALPVFLKAAGGEATGWGHAVRHCATEADVAAAKEDFAKLDVTRLVAEAALEVERCWCANLSVTDEGVRYLGAAEQTFSAPGQQAGSVIDARHLLPEAGQALALEVADNARAQGFLGVCGLDIGLTVDGRMIVFDPNFRFNACTPQVLLHPAAAARVGADVSLSFAGRREGALSDMLARLREPVEEGWFVPFRVIDASLMETAEGVNHCTGFVLGRDRAEAEARAEALAATLKG